MPLIHGRCACGRTTGQLCALCRKLVCWMDGAGCAMRVWYEEKQARVHVRCARDRGLAKPEPPPPPGPVPSAHALKMRAYYREHREEHKARTLARYYALKGVTA